MAKHPGLMIALICICLVQVFDARAEELRPKLDDMVRHFGQVVFGNEIDPKKPLEVLSKWHGPVGIVLQGKPTKQLAGMASRHLNTLSKLTKLKFKQLKPGDPGQSIDLIFMTRAQVAKQKFPSGAQQMVQRLVKDPTMRCFFLKWQSPPERIVKAIIFINTEIDPAQLNACMLEELSQVMGLQNDVDTYWQSIFRPRDTSTELSPWDQLYLKALYDPRMKAGMKPVDALYTARTIFVESMANTSEK
ncbi:MAG: DUF2927 domain-containing protein [Magnetovibrio sp.]|nr:DUF2927 domain-containing protein [Magnetovibrio sp.]